MAYLLCLFLSPAPCCYCCKVAFVLGIRRRPSYTVPKQTSGQVSPRSTVSEAPHWLMELMEPEAQSPSQLITPVLSLGKECMEGHYGGPLHRGTVTSYNLVTARRKEKASCLSSLSLLLPLCLLFAFVASKKIRNMPIKQICNHFNFNLFLVPGYIHIHPCTTQ